ncbi:MAG: menaquinone biosynthesis decarboxylase [Bacteroidales bacterium]|nr:menaquinone biosynthesis decarboxylase [Bacteroidales bacterium]
MYNGLRDYIRFLEQKGELRRITERVDPVLEIACATDIESKKTGGGKALLFENTGTAYPVITNMMGSGARIRYSLGVDSLESIGERIDSLVGSVMGAGRGFRDKLRMLPLLGQASSWAPRMHKGHAPCQDVVQYAAQLSQIPILKCWPQDGGRFITLPLVHTVSPLTGVRNVGMYRMQVLDDSTTGMHWHPHKTGAKHLSECTHRLPVAVCLGGDPVYSYAATAPLPEGVDEYLLAGFLRGKPVELVKCFTQELSVPADCDFVIEGYVQKSEERFMEGPFGDHTGFYSLEDLYPKFHVTCITHRYDAVYPATVVGVPPMEDKYIQEATERIFLSPIKLAISPEVRDMYLPEEGVGHNFAIVKIDKQYEGQAFKVANAMWGAGQMMFNKFIMVVDEDIDIRDWKALFGAICRNVDVNRDLLFSKGPLDVLDHAAPETGFGGKLCIDATRKAKPFEDRPLDRVVNVLFDPGEKDSSLYRKLWLLGANCDPVRDARVRDHLILDATSKRNAPGFRRRWPDIVSHDSEMKERMSELLKD